MEIVRQSLAVALVFGLLAAALWAARRGGVAKWGALGHRPKKDKRLEILERLPLSPRESLYLARLGDRALLIGTGAGAPALLESVPLASLAGAGFAAQLETRRAARGGPAPEASKFLCRGAEVSS
ncbi:MAG: flagellar biosynthetic protein FliO [Bryobacteraceae bacterium]